MGFRGSCPLQRGGGEEEDCPVGLVGKRPLPTFRSTLAAKGWGRTAWFSVLREGRGLVSSWLLLCPPRLAEGRATAMRDAAGGLVLRPAPPHPGCK